LLPGDHVIIDIDGRLDSGFISQGGNYPEIPGYEEKRFDTENSQNGPAKGSVVTDLPSESEYMGVPNRVGVGNLDLGSNEGVIGNSLQMTPNVGDMKTSPSGFGNPDQLLVSNSGKLPEAELRMGRGGLGIVSANDIANRDQVLPMGLAGPAPVKRGGFDPRVPMNLDQIKKIQIEQAQINFNERKPTTPMSIIPETLPEIDPE
jgi:hypothetical protein